MFLFFDSAPAPQQQRQLPSTYEDQSLFVRLSGAACRYIESVSGDQRTTSSTKTRVKRLKRVSVRVGASKTRGVRATKSYRSLNDQFPSIFFATKRAFAQLIC
ncbi:unnamed protein product [Ceratitis capitata]|uniref:(Mediterranean fruit fly) hypothetical protein n=1 Tax=Ceratitis capitata TaxID=7213 RepID=A0A811V4W0_CERCA|nr:unnamed protein product [Ceratitis capitata]